MFFKNLKKITYNLLILFCLFLSNTISANEGFAHGTLVCVPGGFKVIESLKKGDKVISLDLKSGKIIEDAVIDIQDDQVDNARMIISPVSQDYFFAGYDQRFFCPQGEWVKAKKLRNGDLLLASPKPFRIKNENVEGDECGFNGYLRKITLQNQPHFFITKSFFLVHNFDDVDKVIEHFYSYVADDAFFQPVSGASSSVGPTFTINGEMISGGTYEYGSVGSSRSIVRGSSFNAQTLAINGLLLVLETIFPEISIPIKYGLITLKLGSLAYETYQAKKLIATRQEYIMPSHDSLSSSTAGTGSSGGSALSSEERKVNKEEEIAKTIAKEKAKRWQDIIKYYYKYGYQAVAKSTFPNAEEMAKIKKLENERIEKEEDALLLATIAKFTDRDLLEEEQNKNHSKKDWTHHAEVLRNLTDEEFTKVLEKAELDEDDKYIHQSKDRGTEIADGPIGSGSAWIDDHAYEYGKWAKKLEEQERAQQTSDSPLSSDNSPDPDDKEKKERKTTAEDLINEAIFEESKQKATTYRKSGGYKEAVDDFERLGLSNVKHMRNERYEGKIGDLPDGRTVNIRSGSKDKRPTLEIYDPKNCKSIKIRYGYKE